MFFKYNIYKIDLHPPKRQKPVKIGQQQKKRVLLASCRQIQEFSPLHKHF